MMSLLKYGLAGAAIVWLTFQIPQTRVILWTPRNGS